LVKPYKYWLNLTNNDWESLLPFADKKSKFWTRASQDKAIFRLVSNGLQTKRDEWAYDFDRENLTKKFKWLIDQYERARLNGTEDASNIKWDADLSRYRVNGVVKTFEDNSIIEVLYRPFIRCLVYFDKHFNSRVFQLPSMFEAGKKNTIMSFSDPGFRADFCVLASDCIVDLHFGAAVDACQSLWYRWIPGRQHHRLGIRAVSSALRAGTGTRRPITKDALFHYVYGVLHDPAYREKYALNLKREFPRIPFTADF
jgi:predicted helicase